MVLVAEFGNEMGTRCRYRQCNDPETQKAYADLTTIVCHQPKQHNAWLGEHRRLNTNIIKRKAQPGERECTTIVREKELQKVKEDLHKQPLFPLLS